MKPDVVKPFIPERFPIDRTSENNRLVLDSVKSITVSNGTYWSERVKWQIEG